MSDEASPAAGRAVSTPAVKPSIPASSAAPKAELVEVRIQNIQEGKLLKRANKQLREMMRGLISHWSETQTRNGKGVLIIQIEAGALDKSDEIIEFTTKVKMKLPAVAGVSHAKQSDQGYAMAQPTGTNDGDPDQLLFSGKGSLMGTLKEWEQEEAKAAAAAKDE